MLNQVKTVVVLIVGVFCWIVSTQLVFAQSTAEPPVRKIYVPADAPESWPEGDWIPIPSERLREKSSERVSALQSSRWVHTAKYEATLDRETLIRGNVQMEIDHSVDSHKQGGPSLIAWPETKLAFSNLQWESKPAKLGNTSSGQNYLIVSPENQTLTGNWSLKGRTLTGGVFFDLQFPSAAVTEFLLHLPTAYELRVLDNVPVTQQSARSSEEHTYQMSLGSRGKVRFFVGFGQQGDKISPATQLMARAETLVFLARDQSRFRQELLIESLGAPVDSLSIPVPENIQIRTVEYGGLAINSWNVTRELPRLLTVKIPESIEGLGRPLVISGQVSYTESQLWKIPRLWPRESHPLSEEVTLNVSPPHELLAIRHDGFRQSGVSTSTTGTSSLTFQRASPIAEIEVRVGLPPTRLKTEFVTRLNRRKEGLLADVQLMGTLDSGRLYTVWMELAPDWEPVSVEFLDQSTMRLTPDLPWAIESSNGARILRVEFPKAVNRDQPLQLMMSFRGNQESSQPPRVPVVRMTGEIPSQQALLIRRSEFSAEDQSFQLTGWKKLFPNELPTWITNAKKRLESDFDASNWETLVSSKPGFSELPLRVEKDSRQVTIVDRLSLVVENSQSVAIQEELELMLDVGAESLSSTRLTTRSEVDLCTLDWSVLQAGDCQVECRSIAADSQKEGVRLWELSFTPPLQTSSLVIGTRRFADLQNLQAILPLLSGQDQIGKVEVIVPPELTDPSLVLVEFDHIKSRPPDQFLGYFASEYSHEKASLRIQASGDDVIPDQSVVDVGLQSTLVSPSSEEFSHRMLVELRDPASQLRFQYDGDPDGMALFFNDSPIPFTQLDSGWFRSELESPRNGLNQLEFVWGTPVTRHLLDLSGKISVPRLDLSPGQPFRWELHLPDGCRVEDYSDVLLLTTPQPEHHWSQRVFGLLGRDQTRQFFNPFNAEEWSGLFESSSDSASETRWILEFESRQFPKMLSLSVWSPSRHRASAWVVFCLTLLGGVSLRVMRWKGRTALAAWSLALSIIACVLASDSWVLYSGSFTAAVIFVMVFPRVFLLGRKGLTASRDEDITEMTEASTMQRVTVGLLIGGGVLFSGAGAWAQLGIEGSSEKPDAFDSIDLLIPYSGDEPDETMPELIYVRDSQRQASIFASSERSLPVLISSANYLCEFTPQGPAALNVLYVLEVPTNSTLDYFRLPLQGANLAREDGCLVNGQPASVAMSEDGVLEIPLPQIAKSSPDNIVPLRAPRPGERSGIANVDYSTITLELNLFASIDVQKSIRQFQVQIPPVSNSRLVCKWPEEIQIHELRGPQGAITKSSPTNLEADLGNSREVTLRWRSDSADVSQEEFSAQPQVSLEPQFLIEAFPTHLKYRIQVAHRVTSGAVSTLRWELPSHFYFRKVLNQPILQTREFLENEKRVIYLDLKQNLDSTSEPYLVEAEFVVPISSREEDEIVVEIPSLGTPQEESPNFSLLETSTTSLGIWSPPDMPLTLLEFPLEGLNNLTPEEYLKRWPKKATLPKPQLAYELDRPIQLSFLRAESKPLKKVWVKETGIVNEQFLEWEWAGEVQTSQLPAFEHEFLVDSRLEVLSVSVKEDQAERVTRWSRDGNRLTVRLTRKAEESSQNVRIEARMSLGIDKNPTTHEEELTLPAIRLLMGERMESIAQVLLTPTRTARWKQERPRSGGNGVVNVSGRSEELLSFDLYSRLDGESLNETIVIGEKSIPPHLRRSIRLVKRADGDFDLNCKIVDAQPEFIDGSLELFVPSSWVSRLRLEQDGQMETQIERELIEDGILKLTIPEGLRDVSLILRTTISPPDGNRWTVPWPEVSGEATYENFVALKLSDGWAPNQECRLAVDNIAEQGAGAKLYDQWEYLCDQLELQKTELSDPAAIPFIPLFLSRVDIRSGKAIQGRWWFLYRGRGREQLEMKLPFPVSIHAVRQAEESVEYDLNEDHQELAVSLVPDSGWYSYSIDWQSQRPLDTQILSEMSLAYPEVRDVEVGELRMVIASPPELKMMMHHGILPQSRLEYQLTLIETFIRLVKEENIEIVQLPQEVQQLLREFVQESDAKQEFLNDEFEGYQAFLRRYEQGQEILRALMPDRLKKSAERAKEEINLSDDVTTMEMMSGLKAGLDYSGRTVVYAIGNRESETMKAWWLPRFWYLMGIAVAAAAVIIPVFLWGFQESTADWIAQHRVYMWMLIGGIWWFCLQLSFVGLVVFVLAVFSWLLSPFVRRSRVY